MMVWGREGVGEMGCGLREMESRRLGEGELRLARWGVSGVRQPLRWGREGRGGVACGREGVGVGGEGEP